MSRRHLRSAVVLVFLPLGACTSPSVPTALPKPQGPPALLVVCHTTPTLTCSASLYGEGDVTAKATWSAADSFRLAMDVPVTASSAVVFKSPGVPTVLRAQNVYIRADYNSPRYGHLRNIAPHAYALDPGGLAVPLAYVTGVVFTGGIPGNGVVGGATVEIIDGEGTGKQDVTLDANGGYMIEFLRLDHPFTARASKPGYSSDVRQNTGIVDDANGYPSNTSLAFSIDPK